MISFYVISCQILIWAIVFDEWVLTKWWALTNVILAPSPCAHPSDESWWGEATTWRRLAPFSFNLLKSSQNQKMLILREARQYNDLLKVFIVDTFCYRTSYWIHLCCVFSHLLSRDRGKHVYPAGNGVSHCT